MLEKFLHNLMQQAGLKPEQIKDAFLKVQEFDGRFAVLESEGKGFKAALPAFVQDYQARLTRLEEGQAEILRLLRGHVSQPMVRLPEQPINGKAIEHE